MTFEEFQRTRKAVYISEELELERQFTDVPGLIAGFRYAEKFYLAVTGDATFAWHDGGKLWADAGLESAEYELWHITSRDTVEGE
jgi:hypothetical protein